MNIEIARGEGKRRACLIKDSDYFALMTMQNGYQWSSCNVDDEQLHQIADIIEEYFGEDKK